MATNGNKKVAKSCNNFYCEKCEYITMRKSSMDKHNLTAKHQMATFGNTKVAKSCNLNYSCNNCEKYFNDRTGLWKHKKKCIFVNEPIQSDTKILDNDIIMTLIKENSELKNIMMEVIKNGTNNTIISNNNNNSNNKTFNIKFFLN